VNKCAKCGKDIPPEEEDWQEYNGNKILKPCKPCFELLRQQWRNYPKYPKPRPKK
jgi:hypothetical protein